MPYVLIQQEFTQIPNYVEFPLSAFIIGPQYHLLRYDVEDEKEFTKLTHPIDPSLGNIYQKDDDLVYEFPNVPAGSHVDHSYTKVFFEDAVAKYFPNADLGTENLQAGFDDVELVVNSMGNLYRNRVRFLVPLTSDNDYVRSPYFSNRDVRAGDIVRLTDDNGVTVTSSIKAVLPETPAQNSALDPRIGLDAVLRVNPVTPDGATIAGSNLFTAVSGNFDASLEGQYITVAGTTNQTFKIVAVTSPSSLLLDEPAVNTSSSLGWRIGGMWNDINNVEPEAFAITLGYYNADPAILQLGFDATLNVGATYNGFKSKRVTSDVYTVELDAYTGTLSSARFTIYSNSGAFAPRRFQALTAGVLTVESAEGSNITLDFSGATDWALGKAITVTVQADCESASFAAGGAYTGTADLVYRVKVERGGAFYDGTNAATAAKVSIVSSGIDSSGTVLATKNVAFGVGSYGVNFTFTAGSVGTGADEGLVDGDIFYVAALPAKLGPYTIIELAEDLPAPYLFSASPAQINAELFLKIPSVEIAATRSIVDGTTNWSQLENYVTIKAGTATSVGSLVSLTGPAKLTVESARIFVQHRDLLQDNVVSIGSVRTGGEIQRKLGTIHPDNPLAQGVNDAVLNANNAVVYFCGVESNDVAGYMAAIELAKKTDKVYSFVPMTFDRMIQDAVVAHVNAYSTPEVGLWRIAWLAVQDHKQKALYAQKPNGADWVGTVTDDLQVPGTQYRLVTVSGATFVDDNIRATDSVRFNFRLDSQGNVTYDEYVVDEVRTQTTLVLASSLTAPINSSTKMEIVRNFTRDERAANIAYIGGEYNNRRVRMVFPDEYSYAGVKKKGYFMAAALAGLRSGVVPHQGLTNTQVLGADDLRKVVSEFTQDQLNIMAEQGIWLVMQEIEGATPYVRHQLTTDDSGLNTSEDSITTNVDNISYGLKHALAPFIGTYNINPDNLLVIRGAIMGELGFRATQTRTVRAGNQLVSFSGKDILLLQQNPTFKDRVDIEVKLHVPYPMNFISLKLIV